MKKSTAELPFLTFSSDPKSALQDPHVRRVIRVTATQSTRARRRSDFSEQQHLQSNATLSASLKASKSRFRIKSAKPRLEPPPDESKPVQHSPAPQICLWDPIVEPLGGGSWQLLHYYRFDFRPNSWALTPKQDWFAFIIEDAAATHATLSFVSLNRDLEMDGAVSAWSLHHRTRALQIIRTELKKTMTTPKDSLIGAIALLAITEGLEGQPRSSSAHAEALATLIRLRGGFEKLQRNEALSRLVAWADLCYSSSSNSSTAPPTLLEKNDVKLETKSSLSKDQISSVFHQSLREVLPVEMADLILLLNKTPTHPPTDQTSAQERQAVSHRIDNINQILLKLQLNLSKSQFDPSSPILRVLCCATHLYISLVLRQMPQRTKIVVKRTEVLREALDALNSNENSVHTNTEVFAVIKLWALTVHFCSIQVSDRTRERIKELSLAALSADVNNLADLQEKLSMIAWIQPFYQTELRLVISHLSTKSLIIHEAHRSTR